MPEQTDCHLGQTGVAERDTAPTQDCASTPSLSHFLRLLFRLLDEHQVRYCVLHTWQGLPDSLPGDLDVAIHPHDHSRLASVFRTLSEEGYQLIQCRHRGGRGRRYDFVWFEPAGMRSASMDSIDEYVEDGLLLIPGEELLRSREQFKDFWVAHPAVEFAYILAKKAVKGSLPEHQAVRLKALVNELGEPQAQKIADQLFGEKWKGRVVQACANGTLGGLLTRLRRGLWLRKLKKAPLDPLRYMLRDVARLVGRALKPIGLFLVVLGPDGVGKSTLVGRLVESLDQAAFNRFRLFHWRPMVILRQKETGAVVSDPHDEPARGTLGSILALSVLILDYWLGFVFVLRPLLARAGLVIFDRYYHDLLVDPLRYRYGGPMWLAKFLARVIPPPDLLFLVLDADDEVILSRKREVSLDELRRQREGYQQFAGGYKRAILVNTDRGIEPTVEQASRFVVEYLANRFQRRNARWLAPVDQRVVSRQCPASPAAND